MRGLTLVLVFGALAGCGQAAEWHRHSRHAKQLIADYCAACHTVPGVARATGRVGPSLAHIGSQQIIAGYFANTPSMLSEWIRHSQKLLPGNAMPDMDLSDGDTALIVDYLYSLD
jgi:cytochrome c